MKKQDIISLERCIENSKHQKRAIEYGEKFNEKVNRYKQMKNDKKIDSAKKELSLNKNFD